MAFAPARGARQLALDLGHAESFAREDFLEGPSNAAALAMIERWPDWSTPTLALIGPVGAGKSHLAAIWAADAGARFLAGRALREANLPVALATGALVVEDLAEGEFDERSLFHLLNLAREQEAYLLLTARIAPSRWASSLPDLTSRLRAIPVLALDLPDEPLLRAVLVKLFDDRQLQVDEALVGYLIPRLERSFVAVRRAVEELDTEALRQKRPVTRVLAAEVLRQPP
jgi:chromosomal replication initiation ATPase DnaA